MLDLIASGIVLIIAYILTVLFGSHGPTYKGGSTLQVDNYVDSKVDSKVDNYVDSTTSSKSVIIYIKTGHGRGIKLDADILSKILIADYTSNVKILDFADVQKADIIFHIEHINTKNLDPNAIHIWIPNQELITDWDVSNINFMNYILCKTYICEKVINNLEPKGNVVYVGFTSNLEPKPIIEKNRNLFIHFAGTSPYKNTQHVIRSWKELNNTNTTHPVLLVSISSHKDPQKPHELFGKTLNCTKVSDNLYITNSIPNDLYNYYTSIASVAICPSAAEGFGHYIHDAASNGTLPLVTDAPPMNELITDKRLLLNSKRTGRLSDLANNIYLSDAIPADIYDYTDEDFNDKINHLIKMDDVEFQELSNLVKNNSESNTETFKKEFIDFMRKL